MKTFLAALAAGALLSTAAQAATYVNNLQVANGVDLSGLGAGVNTNRLGGFGSDLVYDASSGTYWGMSDRGPGGGVISYAPRLHQFSLTTNASTGAITNFNLLSTVLFKQADGVSNFNGLNPLLLNGSAATLGASFDPEGLVRRSNGNFLVADEYGPSVYEFSSAGVFIRAFETPANLIPTTTTGRDYVSGRPTIITGRQDNRGYEGLTLSPDGTKAYAILQDPLVNEGASNDGRRSRNLRLVEFDVATGTQTRQLIYQVEDIADINARIPGTTSDFSATNQGRSIGVSSIVALPDGKRFLVLERDNRGLGVDDPTASAPVGTKRVYLIDTTGATDVKGISLANTSTLPGGVTAVNKTLFLDIQSALTAAGVTIPEKLEGMAFGPTLADGRISLVFVTDNDFSVTQTGSGTQLDVCTSGAGGTTAQVTLDAACPTGMALIPNNLYAFNLSTAEISSLGLSPVPEPTTWAMMVGGFGLIGAAMRRRTTKVRFAI
jgi:hypothetical protein